MMFACRINNTDALLIFQHQIGFDQVTAIVCRVQSRQPLSLTLHCALLLSLYVCLMPDRVFERAHAHMLCVRFVVRCWYLSARSNKAIYRVLYTCTFAYKNNYGRARMLSRELRVAHCVHRFGLRLNTNETHTHTHITPYSSISRN